jgi:hypothetical protein
MSLCLSSTRHGSSVTLITRCQEKVDVTNQCNFNLNATLQWWISQRRTTKSQMKIMNLRLDYIWSYFPHGNSAFGTSKENVTDSLFWHWFFSRRKQLRKKRNSYVKWFSLQSLGKSGVMMVGSWDDQYFKFVILKIIVKAENVLPHLSKQSFLSLHREKSRIFLGALRWNQKKNMIVTELKKNNNSLAQMMHAQINST